VTETRRAVETPQAASKQPHTRERGAIGVERGINVAPISVPANQLVGQGLPSRGERVRPKRMPRHPRSVTNQARLARVRDPQKPRRRTCTVFGVRRDVAGDRRRDFSSCQTT
jgi:hypothetical protein